MMGLQLFGQNEQYNFEGLSRNKTVIGVTIVTVAVIVIMIIIFTRPGSTWGEWVPVGPEPACGSGVKKYVRQCTLNGVAQDIKKCVGLDEYSDTKEEKYSFTDGCGLSARHIILERVADSGQPGGDANAIHVGDIIVYDNAGKDITTGAIATASSLYKYPASNAVDGNVDTIIHTVPNVKDFAKIWINIDLGADKMIKKIVIKNRTVHQQRIAGTRVRVVNNGGQSVFTSVPISLSDSKKALIEFVLS